MGIIATDIAEAVERTRNDVMTDLRVATSVSLVTDDTGKAWVNVDGVCALRVQAVGTVTANGQPIPPAP